MLLSARRRMATLALVYTATMLASMVYHLCDQLGRQLTGTGYCLLRFEVGSSGAYETTHAAVGRKKNVSRIGQNLTYGFFPADGSIDHLCVTPDVSCDHLT